MNSEQMKQKFLGLVGYYNYLAQKAKDTGGDTELLNRYYVLRDRSRQAVVGGLVRSFHKSDEEIVREFNEKALRIFQA